MRDDQLGEPKANWKAPPRPHALRMEMQGMCMVAE